MMDSNDLSIQPTAGSSTSHMIPLFHFQNQDTVIVELQHNSHFHLLAVLTSANEIFMCGTEDLPSFDLVRPHHTLSDHSSHVRNPLVSSVTDWNPARHTICIDTLPYKLSQLCWAPWRNGVFLAALSLTHGIHLYRFSHSRWVREDVVPLPGHCLHISFSPFGYAIACACESSGNPVIVTQRGALWSEVEEEATGPLRLTTQPQAQPLPNEDAKCACVSWEHSGMFLAAGSQDGRCAVYSVAWKGGNWIVGLAACVVIPPHDSTPRSSGPLSTACYYQQLTWAPLSGRSFLVLLAVVPTGGVVTLFQRPGGLSDSPLENIERNNGKGIALKAPFCCVPLKCREIIRAVWNSSGTMLITSHRDSSVNLWSLDVSYQKRREPWSPSAPNRKHSTRGQYELPTATMRLVSTLDPYL